MQKKWQSLFFFGLLFLFVWSFFLRLYQLGSVPNGLYWDEAAILVDAKSIASTGMDMHGRPWYQVIYPSYGDYKLPVYIWLAGLSVKMLGASDLSVRLPSAIAGFSTILISGYLVKLLLELEIFQKQHSKKSKDDSAISFANLAGIFTSFAVALSPWSILFSRTGFEAHLGQAFLAASLLSMVLSEKRKWLLFVSPILGLLATYSYFSVRFVWLGVFAAYIFLFIFVPELKKRTPITIIQRLSLLAVVPLLIFGLGLLPMLRSPLYEASNTFRLSTDSVLKNDADVIQSNIYREQAGNERVDRVFFYRWWLTGKKLLANYADNVSLNFLFVSGDPNLRHGTGMHGLFLIIFLPFFFIGWYMAFKSYPKVASLLFVWWMLSLLPASVPNTTPHALRSINALVPLATIIGVGLTSAYQKVSCMKRAVFVFSVTTFFALMTILLFQFSIFYFQIYPSLSASAWQGGFEQMTSKMYTMRDKHQPVYVLPFDDRFYLWLLAYGPYSTTEIQQFPKSQFQVREFDQIFTEHIPGQIADEVILIGSENQVAEFVQKSHYTIESSEIVRTPQTIYEVAKVKKGFQ